MVGGVDDQVEWTCIAGCHCFISSFCFQGHQSHPDNQENNNGFCLELLADVAVFSTLIHNLKIGFCYLGSMLVYLLFGFFLFWQKRMHVQLGVETDGRSKVCSKMRKSLILPVHSSDFYPQESCYDFNELAFCPGFLLPSAKRISDDEMQVEVVIRSPSARVAEFLVLSSLVCVKLRCRNCWMRWDGGTARKRLSKNPRIWIKYQWTV